MENEWNVYAYFRFIHHLLILEFYPNYFLLFGDFDLAGINIFLFEFHQYLGKERSLYLIPDDIEFRLQSGSRNRYDEQYSHFKDVKSEVFELQQLIALIHRKRKAYD